MRRLSGSLVLLVASGCLSPSSLGALVPPTAEQDSRLPQIQIEVAGRKRAIHLETFGDSDDPLLLVLHGSLSDYRAMRPFRSLSDRYRVVMWDRRGNGLSERISADEFSFESVVAEIDAVRRHFGEPARVSLLGHSFGAMFASLYASTHPEHVEQLVLVEPAGLNGEIFGATYDQIVSIDLFSARLSETYWQNDLLSPSSHEAMDYKALLLLENTDQTNYFCDADRAPRWPVWRPGAYVDYVRAKRMGASGLSVDFQYDFAKGMETFPREVLLIGGTCGALGAEYQRKHHVPLFAKARVATIPNTGHRMFVEDFAAVERAVRGYLSRYAAADQ